MSELRVFENDYEHWIAHDLEEVCAAQEVLTGEHEDRAVWRELADDETIRIWCDGDLVPCEQGEGHVVEKTAKEWVEHMAGRITTPEMLCSTEA